MKKILTVLIVTILLLTTFASASQKDTAPVKKKAVTSIDQLPRHTYDSTAPVKELINNDALFAAFAAKVRHDVEQDLENYEIEDTSTLKKFYGVLLNLDVLDNNYAKVQERIELLRNLETKEAAKLLIALELRTILAAAQEVNASEGEAFLSAFTVHLEKTLKQMPWETIQEKIIDTKGQLDMITANFLLGLMESAIEPGRKKAGYISSDMALQIISARYIFKTIMPVRTQILKVYGNLIDTNRIAKVDIWADRQVDLRETKGLEPLTVAVWDTGVDTSVFPNNLWTNPNEKVDGKDTDGNGYVDDVHGIAYDMKAQPVSELLFPIAGGVKSLQKNLAFAKGYNGLTNSIDIPEAVALKQRLSQMKPAEVEGFMDDLMDIIYFIHGTHVAGIVIEGNPYARVLVARVTMDDRRLPDVPTMAVAQRTAKMYKDVVHYFKTHGVRVVNMSWSVSLKEVEADLTANGVGKNSEELGKMARELFSVMKQGFKEAIQGAPEILFVVAAGNSDDNPEFLEEIPTGLGLPNLMVAGAVDQAGDRTSFTSFGKIVDIYSNGYQVVSFLPGGDKMPASGTSMASPNVVNLAAKLFTLNPKLNAIQVKELILNGATKNEKENFLLLHPKQSVKLLEHIK